MDNVSIEVSEPDETNRVLGPGELWITVTGPDPLPDYQKVRKQLDRADIPTRPARYYPSLNGPGEPYTEVWVVKRIPIVA